MLVDLLHYAAWLSAHPSHLADEIDRLQSPVHLGGVDLVVFAGKRYKRFGDYASSTFWFELRRLHDDLKHICPDRWLIFLPGADIFQGDFCLPLRHSFEGPDFMSTRSHELAVRR